MRLISQVGLVFITLVLAACGDGGGSTGGSTGGTSGTTSGTITQPIAFVKSSAEFTQYEYLIIEVDQDDCRFIGETGDIYLEMGSLGYIYPSYKNVGGNYFSVEVPRTYYGNEIVPGTYQIGIGYSFDSSKCTINGVHKSYVAGSQLLDFTLKPAITVASPEVYLEERLNDSIAMVDELLLSATDQAMIDYLTQLRADLDGKVALIPGMSSYDIQEEALRMLNNTPDIPELPAGTVAEYFTCKNPTWNFASAISLCRASWITGSIAGIYTSYATAGVGLLVSTTFLTYHLSEFYKEMTAENYWSNVATAIYVRSGAKAAYEGSGAKAVVVLYDDLFNNDLSVQEAWSNFLENWKKLPGEWPTGIVVDSTSVLEFSEYNDQVLTTKITRSPKQKDRDIVEVVKKAVSTISWLFPSSVTLISDIEGASSADKEGYIVDDLVLSSVISDPRLEIVSMNSAGVSFRPKSGVVLQEGDTISFNFSFSTYHDQSYQYDGLLYQHTAPYLSELTFGQPILPDIVISDDRLEVATLAYVSDGLQIAFKPKVGAVIPEDSFAFTFSYNDFLGREISFDSIWYKQIPPPRALDKRYWYDARIGGQYEGSPGDYTTPISDDMGVEFAETIELVQPPQYLLPGTVYGGDYFSVWTDNGVENSITSLYVDWSNSLSGYTDNGGDITDTLQYRAHNAQGSSDIQTLSFQTKYAGGAQIQPMDLASFVTSGNSWMATILTGTEGWLDPNYAVELDIEQDWSGANYTLTMKVVDKQTDSEVKVTNSLNQIVDNKDTRKEVYIEFLDANKNWIPLDKTIYYYGVPNYYEISRLSNGQESFDQALTGTMSYEALQSVRGFRLKQPRYYCYDVPYPAVRGYRAECWD